jgi:hypothetical protein
MIRVSGSVCTIIMGNSEEADIKADQSVAVRFLLVEVAQWVGRLQEDQWEAGS